MPPKTVFSKEQIVEAAFALFAQEGMDSITVRRLAAKLGSSTAPIYTSFKNVEELKEILLKKALDLLVDYTCREYTGRLFLDIGVGMLEYARDYRIIYRTLFMTGSEYNTVLNEFKEKSLQQMMKDSNLHWFSRQEMESLMEKMFVFTHGLAAFLCTGMLENESRQYFISTLFEMGEDVICSTLIRSGKRIPQNGTAPKGVIK